MQIENITNPGVTPVHGDWIRVTHPTGAIEERSWIDLPPEPLAPSYRSIDKVEAMGLIRSVSGMSAAEELAFRDDPNLALFWRIWREDVGNVIWRDHQLTAQILDAIEAAGYIGPAQRQAVLDNWPIA